MIESDDAAVGIDVRESAGSVEVCVNFTEPAATAGLLNIVSSMTGIGGAIGRLLIEEYIKPVSGTLLCHKIFI